MIEITVWAGHNVLPFLYTGDLHPCNPSDDTGIYHADAYRELTKDRR